MISRHTKIIVYSGNSGYVRLSKCFNCNVKFKMYNDIFSKRGGNGRVKRYCIKCATRFNML